jgi:hypothetical protein
LIAFEIAFEAGIETFPTHLCRKRSGRKPCKTPLGTITEDEASYVEGKVIYWHCQTCEDSGMVYGWQGLMCDLSGYDFQEDRFQ